MKNVRVSIALVAVLFCKLLLLCPHPVMAQTTVVVRNDFEDGTLQGWTPRGNSVVLTNTTEAVVPQDDTGIHSNFESGTTEGWGPRGGVNLTVTTADQHSAAYSLVTTNRTANWHFPVGAAISPGDLTGPHAQLPTKHFNSITSDTITLTVTDSAGSSAASSVNIKVLKYHPATHMDEVRSQVMR
jgi:hypothetical protein